MSVRSEAASSDQSASKRFLKTHLADGRRFIMATTGASCGTTLAIILQAGAVARSIQLVVIERAGLSSVVPWLLVFAAGSTLRCICAYLAQRWPAEGALRIQQQLRRSVLDAAFVPLGTGVPGLSLALSEAQAAETAHTLLEQVDKLEPFCTRYVPRLICIARLTGARQV